MRTHRLLLGIMVAFICASLFAGLPGGVAQTTKADDTLPAKFDLRTKGLVTPIRRQSGGTCWTHGAVAAIESNLLKNGVWAKLNHKGMPNLAEYHLDWWNGFNRHHNFDVKKPAETRALRVHVGGDYLVTAAYISRGDGVVYSPDANDGTEKDAKWYKKAPKKLDKGYQRFYVRDIEWFVLGKDLTNIDAIKKRIMNEGAIGTAYCVSKSYITKENIHYQPQQAKRDPNHAVAIVGWDDTKITKGDKNKPPAPGAWLIKNSWGKKRGDKGYYWISYYDKHCCRHPEMGAVSFRNTEPLRYQHFYLHDYHGWRGKMPTVTKAFNAFTATGNQQIQGVSFYTTTDNVRYTATIYRQFTDGQLSDVLATKKGVMAVTGLHTIDLDAPISVQPNQKFYVCLEVSSGGHAIDRTSQIKVLLGKRATKPMVTSKAQPGESYYHDGTQWKDLYEYDFDDPDWGIFDRTANFCMKALAVDAQAATAPGR